MGGMVFCRGCGREIHQSAASCPGYCGARQQAARQGKGKATIGVLALLLGGLGIHRFYLGQWWGIFTCCLSGRSFHPSQPSLGIVFLCTGDAAWEQKYG